MNEPNIIFIIIDTLRQDSSKIIERILNLNGFISYSNVIAPSSWTTPTHASIFTGLYPFLHQAHETSFKKDYKITLSNKYNLITNLLGEYGYCSRLFSANPYIRPEFGFSGFKNFYDVPFKRNHSLLLSKTDRKKIDVIKKNKTEYKEIIKNLITQKEYNLLIKLGMEFLLKKPYTRFDSMITKWPKDKGSSVINESIKKNIFSNKHPHFLFMNLMEVHEPYYLNDTLSEDFVENLKTNFLDSKKICKWKRKYDAEIEYINKKISELMIILKEKNMFDNSLIVITSDHGQLLGEHNRIWHGLFLYNELIEVPLWIKYPKNSSVKLYDPSDKYISHVNFKQFLIDVVTNSLRDDAVLYSDTVFSESYGLTTSKNLSKLNQQERKKFEKYKVALFNKGLKCIFNVSDWKIESITKDNDEFSSISYNEDFFKKEIIKFFKRKKMLTNIDLRTQIK